MNGEVINESMEKTNYYSKDQLFTSGYFQPVYSLSELALHSLLYDKHYMFNTLLFGHKSKLVLSRKASPQTKKQIRFSIKMEPPKQALACT